MAANRVLLRFHVVVLALALAALAGCRNKRRNDAPDVGSNATNGSRDGRASAASGAFLPSFPGPSRVRWEPTEFVTTRPSARGWLGSGRRVVRDELGERRVKGESPDLEHVARVPAKLGGGFVFLGERDVYFAERFDGPLVTVVHRDPKDRASRVGFALGFDSIYLQYANEALMRYALPGGKKVPLDPPGALRILAHPSGDFVVAAVESGYLMATAAGAWKPLTIPVRNAETALWWKEGAAPGADVFLAQSKNGLVEVKADGTTTPSHEAVSPTLIAGSRENAPYVVHTPEPLQHLGDIAYPYDDHTALVIGADVKGLAQAMWYDVNSGQVLRNVTIPGVKAAALATGRVLHVRELTLIAFRVQDETQVFRIEEKEVVTELRIRGADTTMWDQSALTGDVVAVVRGRCVAPEAPSPAADASRVFCMRLRDGAWRQSTLPEVAGLDYDGALWASSGKTLLALVGQSDKCVLAAPLEERRAEVPCTGSSLIANLRTPATVTTEGRLRSFRLVDAGYVVATYGLDATVKTEPVPENTGLQQVGRRALLARPDGTLAETADFGRTWLVVPSPPEGPRSTRLPNGSLRKWIAECSDFGCSFYDGTVRVGWEQK